MKRFVACQEELTRRSFLAGAGAVLSLAAYPRLAIAAGDPPDGRLLVILLRGGMDGLFAVPPLGDKALGDHRKDLVERSALPLDGFFAVHPAMPNFHDLYKAGQAMVVHGTSIPYKQRSHFEGQNMMEGGMDTPYASNTGWLGRALDAAGLPAITMSLPVPLILRGRDFAESSYPSFMYRPPAPFYKTLLPVWEQDAAIGVVGRSLVDSIGENFPDIIRDESAEPSVDELAVQAVTHMASADGPRIGVIDDVGYDTHSQEVNHGVDKLRQVDSAIGTFRRGLRPELWQKTLIVTVTEFGRTINENGAWGTDHGYGTCVLVAGGLLKKSGVVADWPGLKPKNLFEGRDLLATIDARSVYAAAVSATLGLDPDLVRAKVISAPKDDRFSAYL